MDEMRSWPRWMSVFSKTRSKNKGAGRKRLASILHDSGPTPVGAAATVSLLYVAFFITYVLVTDYLIARYVDEIQNVLFVQLIKSLLAISISAVLIYLLVKRFLTRLTENRTMYEQILQNIRDAVFLVRRADRRIVYANDATKEVLGYEPKSLVGRTTRILYQNEEDHRRFAEKTRRDFESQNRHRLRFRLRRRDGVVIPTQHHLAKFTGPDGEEYAISLIRDLTKEVETERKRKLYERRLERIVEAVPVPLAMVRAEDDRIIFTNHALLERLELDERALRGDMKAQKLFVSEADYKKLRQQVLEDGEMEAIEVRLRIAPDAEIWAAATSRLIEYDGQQMLVTAFVDISAMRKSRELLARAQRLEAVGQLTNGVAHDFNNMLTVILLNCEAIADASNDRPEIEAHARDAIAAGTKAAQLTEKLHTFSRNKPAAPQILDLNEVIQDQYPLLRRAVGSNIEIAVLLDDRPAVTQVDRSSLENAIINLVANARDAMPDGGTITIRTDHELVEEGAEPGHSHLEPGYYVALSISDEGCGMNRETVERAFEPFFTTKESGGTGLGLSLVYGFATASGGAAAIESELGHGTTVTVCLPREFDVDGLKEAVKLATTPPTGCESILLVEDDRQIRNFATDQLESLGYTVTAFGDSDNALAEIQDQGSDYDLLLTDIVMPGSNDGYALAREARKLRPGVGILLTSGYIPSPPEDAADFEILPKPFTRVNLAQRVRDVLDARSRQAEKSVEQCAPAE